MKTIDANINHIKETSLWKKLNNNPSDVAQFLSNNIIPIADEVLERSKLIPINFKEYTLHDQNHLLRVVEISSMILGEMIDKINPLEISILILASLMHDQGMIITNEEYLELQNQQDYLVFRDNWFLDHPNRMEIVKELNSTTCNAIEKVRLAKCVNELDQALLTDHLRNNHGSRSADYILNQFGSDKRLEVFGVNLSPYIAKLAESHCYSVEHFKELRNFNYDEQIGQLKVNLPYLGVILRLADILDFDNERTPDVLFRSIHFTSKTSLLEWNKHRGVKGWRINKEEILYSMQFEHPVYESTARKFLDYIDNELNQCHNVVRNFPSTVSNYSIDLPTKVDRSRIGPKDKSYIFYDLEFSISRDEIIKLLMTDKLYNHPSLCIRELLQNSLDALRFRKALLNSAEIKWNAGQVKFTHELDNHGYEIITCEDEGVGMDEKVIINFLGKVGRSYYRSPEYEQQRLEFKKKGVDFDPCSQFGIGFMSCFMLGDRIKIETRKDYGYGRDLGRPLIVEINGLGGMFVIREGNDDQSIGTKITIYSRKKPTFFDEWTDRVNLVLVLKGYALCTEFEIKADCKIEEIKDTLYIPPVIEKPITLFQYCQLKNINTYEIDLNDIDKRLSGYLLQSFLIDENKLPTTENDEGYWIIDEKGHKDRTFQLKNSQFQKRRNSWEADSFGATVSIDGIYVGGDPGRTKWKSDVGHRLGSSNSGLHPRGICLIDIRGDIKPEITPSRRIPDYGFYNFTPKWENIKYLVDKAESKILNKLLEQLTLGLSPIEFLKITSIYRFWLPYASYNYIYNYLKIPVEESVDKIEWLNFAQVDELELVKNKNSFLLKHKNKSISLPHELTKWEEEASDKEFILWSINCAVLATCTLIYREKKFFFKPQIFNDNEIPKRYFIDKRLGISGCLIDFDKSLDKIIAIEEYYPIGNKNHPLSKIYFESLFISNKTDIQEFASAFAPCIIELVSLKDEKNNLDNPNRWAKYCAHKYFEVNWQKYSDALKAPYHILSKVCGYVEIDEATLIKWKNLPITES